MSGHDHHHDHDHHHGHDHDHGPFQPDIEDRPLTHYQAMTEAVAPAKMRRKFMALRFLRRLLSSWL